MSALELANALPLASQMAEFLPVLVMLLFALGFAALNLVLSFVLPSSGPRIPVLALLSPSRTLLISFPLSSSSLLRLAAPSSHSISLLSPVSPAPFLSPLSPLALPRSTPLSLLKTTCAWMGPEKAT